jgi:hypothetical protein
MIIGVLERSEQHPSFGSAPSNRKSNPFAVREQPNCPEPLLPDSRSQQQHHSGGDDRQQIARAREAAEALFRPKRQPIAASVPKTPPAAVSSARKPRVLAIASPAPVHVEREAPVSAKQQMTPEIPRSQFDRVRTWVKYGMTAPQVAEVYRVAVDEVERILRKA